MKSTPCLVLSLLVSLTHTSRPLSSSPGISSWPDAVRPCRSAVCSVNVFYLHLFRTLNTLNYKHLPRIVDNPYHQYQYHHHHHHHHHHYRYLLYYIPLHRDFPLLEHKNLSLLLAIRRVATCQFLSPRSSAFRFRRVYSRSSVFPTTPVALHISCTIYPHHGSRARLVCSHSVCPPALLTQVTLALSRHHRRRHRCRCRRHHRTRERPIVYCCGSCCCCYLLIGLKHIVVLLPLTSTLCSYTCNTALN